MFQSWDWKIGQSTPQAGCFSFFFGFALCIDVAPFFNLPPSILILCRLAPSLFWIHPFCIFPSCTSALFSSPSFCSPSPPPPHPPGINTLSHCLSAMTKHCVCSMFSRLCVPPCMCTWQTCECVDSLGHSEYVCACMHQHSRQWISVVVTFFRQSKSRLNHPHSSHLLLLSLSILFESSSQG